MSTLAIVQARLSSTRLPAKVLEPIEGRALLWHTVTRLRAAATQDDLLVAMSDEPSDDPLAAYCAREGFPVFRGSLEDVLDRFREAARSRDAARVVRVTSDCPMLDPAVVAAVASAFDPARHDYVSNTIERSYPDGLDTEILSAAALETASREATLPSEREHVTPFVWKHPERFRLHQVVQAEDHSAERWTVDEPRDLAFARAVFHEIGRIEFGQADVLALLARRPELREINAGIEFNEGYRRSLERDRAACGEGTDER